MIAPLDCCNFISCHISKSRAISVPTVYLIKNVPFFVFCFNFKNQQWINFYIEITILEVAVVPTVGT